jgi:hypothetical protein
VEATDEDLTPDDMKELRKTSERAMALVPHLLAAKPILD